jgi:acyl carrier protein
MLSIEDFVTRIGELISIEVPPSWTPYDELYNGWGLDSLQAFSLIVVIEAISDTVVPPEEIPELYTPADAYDYYCDLVSAAAASQ